MWATVAESSRAWRMVAAFQHRTPLDSQYRPVIPSLLSTAALGGFTMQDTTERLEYLRGQLRAECISWGELHELQGLAEHIDPSDAELREAAGLPEHDDETVEGVYIVTIRNTGDERAIDGADIRQALRDYATTMGTADSLISVDVESA